MERTTKLELLKSGASYTWGELLHIYEMGEYAIVEYHPWKVKSPQVLTGNADVSMREFHCYVRGDDCACSRESLDSALAYCIAYKHEGANTRASAYFMKMIKS